MAELIREDSGLPKPQYEKEDGSGFEALKGKSGAMFVYSKDGHNEALGSKTDTEAASGDGSLIALVKNLRTRLASLEARLSSGINVGNFPTTQQVSGTVSVSNFPATQNVNVQNQVSVNDSTPIKVHLAGTNEKVAVRAAVVNAGTSLDVYVVNPAMVTLPVYNTGVIAANVTAAQANTPQLIYDINPLRKRMESPNEYIIKAMSTNTGRVFICGQQSPPGTGIPLNPGAEFRIMNAGELFFSAENAGDGIHVLIGTINEAFVMGEEPEPPSPPHRSEYRLE